MRKKIFLSLVREAEAEWKKKKAAEMEKRKAEMWNKGAAEVLSVTATVAKKRLFRELPKWEESFRFYNKKITKNIFVMVPSSGFSIYCLYEHIFKNVGKAVEILEGDVKDLGLKLKEAEERAELDKQKWVSKADFGEYAKKVNKLSVDVAYLKAAHKRTFSNRYLTINPLPPEQAAAIADMRHEWRRHEWRQQQWRKS